MSAPTRTGERPDWGSVLRATVTPLASILGSGLLIIVPVLERSLGVWSLVGITAVCVVAWWVGTAVRHNVRHLEPRLADGSADPVTVGLDRIGDKAIVVAYVISVALYLRIMAAYIVDYFSPGGDIGPERMIACAAVGLIVVVGVVRGFDGLDLLDRISLVFVLALTAVLGFVLLVHDVGMIGEEWRLPPGTDASAVSVLTVLGGILITVQGFETVRYLGEEFDPETRVWASRLAQLVAASIYIGFVLVCTPQMGLGTADGPDATLLEITDRVLPLLAIPLVLSAVMSQFSAAVADTVAADGNLRRLSALMTGPRPYLASGVVAIALAATVPTYSIVAIASRAFALYYAIQAVLAFRTCARTGPRLGYLGLTVLLAGVVLFGAAVE